MKRYDNSSKGKFFSKDDTNISSCYSCDMPNHMLGCSVIQKIAEKQRFKIKKDNKKAMVNAWNDKETGNIDINE